MSMRENNKQDEEEEEAWTTWDELLLTAAVKRHGVNDWNAIALELQNRASSVVLTAQICRTKFHHLKRRFNGGDAAEDGGGGDDCVPWIEDLKRLRMAELRRKVHGHGVSIQ